MATTLVFPDSEVAIGGMDWNIGDCDPNPHECLWHGVDTPDDSENLSTEDWVGIVLLGTGNPNLEGGECTSIRVRLRSEASGGANLAVGIYDGAAQIGADKNCAGGNGAYANNWTGSWGGLSLTEANLTDLRVRVDSDDGGPCFLSEVEVELTYTPAPSDRLNINIGDDFKALDEMQINIGDVWKDITEVKINIGDVWKDVF